MRTFINSNLVLWSASCHHAEGASFEERFKVTTYPFLALLLCHPGRRAGTVSSNSLGSSSSGGGSRTGRQSVSAEVVGRMEGRGVLTPEPVMNWLTSTMLSFQNHLDDMRRQREQTQRDTELRAEQERNFQEALEADQRRQREAAEAREREEEAARLEAQRQAEREEEERRALEEAKAALCRKRDAIGEEPPAGPGVTRLRFQFPNGQKVTRRFQQDETVGSVKTFLEVHCADNDFALQTLGISSSHPKRDYDNDSETLVECGLHPQAALFVRDLDA
mmetsp:Transcript_15976/g.60897  ORF Transcript_15976/g.60897 Transcript_15976/m.60897 type:complete len:277 (+) Transcript_15976:711-1541(+)